MYFSKLTPILLWALFGCAHVAPAPVSQAPSDRPWRLHDHLADSYLTGCGFRDITSKGEIGSTYQSTVPCRFTVGPYPELSVSDYDERSSLEVQMLDVDTHQYGSFTSIPIRTEWGIEYEMQADVTLTQIPEDSDNGPRDEYIFRNLKILKRTPVQGPACFILPVHFGYDFSQRIENLEKQASNLLGQQVSCSTKKICQEMIKDPNGARQLRLCFGTVFKDLKITE